MQVGHRLQQARRTPRNHRNPAREVDVDGRFEPGPGYGDDDALLATNVADKSNLSGQSRLIHELPGAIGGFAATRDVESCRNGYVADGYDGGRCGGVDLDVIQKEHAHRERDDEWADKQPQAEVKVARPAIQRLLARGLRHRVTIVTSIESVSSNGEQLFVRLSRRAAAADDLLAFHLERGDPFVDGGEA